MNWFDFDFTEKSDLDKFYSRLHGELKSYVNHLLLTLKIYAEDKKRSVENIEAVYSSKVDLVSGNFNRLYFDYLKYHDEPTAYYFASIDSGMANIEYERHFSIEHIEEEYIYTIDSFLKSSLIFLYSILESFLKELCLILQNKTQTKLNIEDITSRDYLKSFYIYIEKVIGLNLSAIETYKNKLKDFQNIRNILVHNLSLSAENQRNDTKLTKILESYKGIKRYSNKLELNNIKILYPFLQSTIWTFQELYWIIDEKFNFESLTSNLNKAIKQISNKLSIKIKAVNYIGLNSNFNYRNKKVDSECYYQTKNIKIKLKVTIIFKIHQTTPAINIKFPKGQKLSKSLRSKIYNLKTNPYKITYIYLKNFYLTHSLHRNLEVRVNSIHIEK